MAPKPESDCLRDTVSMLSGGTGLLLLSLIFAYRPEGSPLALGPRTADLGNPRGRDQGAPEFMDYRETQHKLSLLPGASGPFNNSYATKASSKPQPG